MKIKDLPEQNRPRERFLKQGPEALSDAELFAVILRTGSRGGNVAVYGVCILITKSL